VQNKATSQITNQLESAVYRLNASAEKIKSRVRIVPMKCLVSITLHSTQTAFNKTLISFFEKKLPQSNIIKSSRKLNSSSTKDAEQPQ